MKALELLYQYQQADEIAGGYMSKPIDEVIKELEELKNRKCINCKSFDRKNDKCERGVSTHYRSEIDDYYSFSCSRWETK